MVTTIQISNPLLEQLKQMRIHNKESYEEIIWDMIEDRMELSEETKKAIKNYEKDIKEGNWNNFVSFKDVKKELRIDV